MKTIIKYYILIIFLIYLFTIPSLSIVKAWTYTDDYPYPNSTQCQWDGTGCVVDPWYFFERQCTSYAAWMVNHNIREMYNTMTGPNSHSGSFGNAETWDNNAKDIGFDVDETTAHVNNVAVWDKDGCSGCDSGHVAYVRALNNSNVNISEYNWNWGDGNYNERTNVSAQHYINFGAPVGTQCGTNNVTIQNQSFYPELSFSCSGHNSIQLNPTVTVSPGSDFYLYIN